MSFKKKIDMLLEAKKLDKLSINKMERDLGLDGTIYKGVKNPDYIPDPGLVSEIVRKYNIRKQWWDKDWETGSNDIFNTSVPESTDNTVKMKSREEMYQDLVEANSDYSLVPKIILEKYQLLPKEESEDRREILKTIERISNQLVSEKERLILEKESKIEQLRQDKKDLEELVKSYEKEIDQLEELLENKKMEAETLKSQLTTKVA
jgi:DNA repair exonuclease SbcCD ATPase subunit